MGHGRNPSHHSEVGRCTLPPHVRNRNSLHGGHCARQAFHRLKSLPTNRIGSRPPRPPSPPKPSVSEIVAPVIHWRGRLRSSGGRLYLRVSNSIARGTPTPMAPEQHDRGRGVGDWDEQAVIDATHRWSRRGHRAEPIPFARRVSEAGLIRYAVTDAAGEEPLLEALSRNWRRWPWPRGRTSRLRC